MGEAGLMILLGAAFFFVGYWCGQKIWRSGDDWDERRLGADLHYAVKSSIPDIERLVDTAVHGSKRKVRHG